MIKRLLFSRADLTVVEDQDYPDDPAPYLTVSSGALAFSLELEEARDLARSIREWIRDVAARELRAQQALERERADILERQRRADRNAQIAGVQRPPLTMLEAIQQANRLKRTG